MIFRGPLQPKSFCDSTKKVVYNYFFLQIKAIDRIFLLYTLIFNGLVKDTVNTALLFIRNTRKTDI